MCIPPQTLWLDVVRLHFLAFIDVVFSLLENLVCHVPFPNEICGWTLLDFFSGVIDIVF
jgi:hypothetical protein